MKNGMYLGFAIAALVFVNIGCHSRNFTNVGKGANGHEYGVPADSIDGYAKAHGISREEAAKRMRAELVPPSNSNADMAPTETTAASSQHTNK